MNFYFLIIIFIILYIMLSRKELYLKILNKKRRKRKMPQELMKEFIGKVCSIMLFNNSFGVQGRIVAIEENWIKVDEKNKIRIINGDMIQDISILLEKYQK